MKLVSFSGAQSTGKTTLLERLYDVNQDNTDIGFVHEVTRRLKREYGVPINEEATVMTQHLIMADHWLNVHDVRDKNSLKLKILDRCSLDGEVYCRYFAKRFFEETGPCGVVNGDTTDQWMEMARRAERISGQLIPEYDLIFLPDHRDVPLVDDGERSAAVDFRNGIIDGFHKRISQYFDIEKSTGFKEKLPKFVLLSGTVEQRLATIKEEITLLDSELDFRI